MKKIILSISLLFLLLLTATSAIAVPAPPEIAVNHETKECAEFFGGDECMYCSPPEGWEILGESFEVECPADYTWTSIDPDCSASKGEFCCSEGHSGASGDCEDMVVNKKEDQCAFVDDINACNLPRGWEAKPDNVLNYEWVCPNDSDWVDAPLCVDQTDLDKDDQSGIALPCVGTSLSGILFAFGLVLNIQVRKKKTI